MINQDGEGAWRAGYLAGMKGAPISNNPYAPDDAKGQAWISGYIEGKANPDRLPQMRPMGPRINGSGQV